MAWCSTAASSTAPIRRLGPKIAAAVGGVKSVHNEIAIDTIVALLSSRWPIRSGSELHVRNEKGVKFVSGGGSRLAPRVEKSDECVRQRRGDDLQLDLARTT